MSPEFDDAFSIFAGIFAGIMCIVMFIAVTQLHARWKKLDEENNYDPRAIRKYSKRMLLANGLWMISVGLVLIAFGSAGSSIGVIGMGILVIIGAAYGFLTGEWLEKRRPSLRDDDGG